MDMAEKLLTAVAGLYRKKMYAVVGTGAVLVVGVVGLTVWGKVSPHSFPHDNTLTFSLSLHLQGHLCS